LTNRKQLGLKVASMSCAYTIDNRQWFHPQHFANAIAPCKLVK